jgi:hypothetical protein
MSVTTTAPLPTAGRPSGSLYDVLELILDRGLVIDVFVRVKLIGIEILTVDARVVVASVDTYLRFAEVCGRTDLTGSGTSLTGLTAGASVPGLARADAGRVAIEPAVPAVGTGTAEDEVAVRR